jgi:hypothetical protein
VGSDLVGPGGDDLSGMGQGSEPVLIEAFVSEFTVKRLDKGVLHSTTGYWRL